MQNIRVIREEAQKEEQLTVNTVLLQLGSINQTQSLLNELKSVQLSTPMDSLTQLLQSHHIKFEAEIKQVSVKQLNIIKQLKGLHIDQQMGRIDSESERVLKRVTEFDEVRQQTDKYKTLIDMMKQSLAKLEQQVDTMVDRKLAQTSSRKQKPSE